MAPQQFFPLESVARDGGIAHIQFLMSAGPSFIGKKILPLPG
jgi:hypothetical protein